MAIEYGEVGVFPNFDAADAAIQTKLFRGIDGDHLQDFVLRQAAVLHDLGGFLIEVPH